MTDMYELGNLRYLPRFLLRSFEKHRKTLSFSRFSRKMLPKPEEVPKKPKSRGENLAKTCGGTKKNQKRQSSGGLGLGGLKNFGFFGTFSGFSKIFTSKTFFFFVPPHVLAVFSWKTLPKPEEAPKKYS